MEQKHSYFYPLLKVLAFLLPMYFVYYGYLHDKPEDPRVRTLWKYVFSGFVFYGLLLLFLVVFNR